jgi:hypothetical protein
MKTQIDPVQPKPTLADWQAEEKSKLAPFQAKYPQLFSKLNWLEIQEGWYDIVWNISAVIQRHLDQDVPEELKDQIYFMQIKEKFGGIRLYISHSTPYIYGAISMAEATSSTTCEVCGRPGSFRNIRNWFSTLCDQHAAEREKDKP